MEAPSTGLVIDPHVFVPQSSYKPLKQYYDHVLPLLPKIWRLKQDSFWTYSILPNARNVVQGWKIHVSAIPESALRILGKVVPVCVAYGVDFKFASDRKILGGLLSKNCSRGSGGKFITIYPPNYEAFTNMLDALYPQLMDENGPHILSDKQYKDSTVLHYRYGGFHSFPILNVDGSSKLCILDDKFEYLEDVRTPVFSLPGFVSDKLDYPDPEMDGELESEEDNERRPFGGKYEILSVIKFSNAGGVYLAKNAQTQASTIVKEARPFIGLDIANTDAVARLKKEFRILAHIADLKIAPKPFDLFQEWDHTFLAVEFIEGMTLRQHVVKTNKLIHAKTSASDMVKWLTDIVTISMDIIRIFIKLHGRSIVFGDLSLNNIMINPSTLELTLIDFEAAAEAGVDDPSNMFTPGYARDSRMERDESTLSDDHYALGCTLLALLAPNVTLLEKRSDFVDVFFGEVCKEIDVPAAFIECVRHLLADGDVDLGRCLEKLKSCVVESTRGISPETCKVERDGHVFAETIKRIYDYNLSVMDVSSRERVFPAGPKLGDPMAVDNGMLGIAYAWKRINGSIPPEFEAWIEQKSRISGQRPGLMNGLSGSAWVLSELGFADAAALAIDGAGNHALLFQNMSLGYGAAGYGLSILNLWRKTANEQYLSEAVRIADVLCDTATAHPHGYAWGDPDGGGGISVGLMEGASGIALFLLYAFCATGDVRYLNTGEKGMLFDMACGREIDGALGFPRNSGAANKVLFPYLAYGSAGVASVALRYYMMTKKAEYINLVHGVKNAVAQKYSISPDLFNGLAGLGNYMLDVYQHLGDETYLDLAYRLAHGLKLFEMPRLEGSAFIAFERAKINSDYASGSAGIALFLHRMINGEGNFNFMMDDLLEIPAVSVALTDT
ncbi:class III lanthionine synthetase LanKC [Janthinobacterium fluminis]|uniref:non-specific serine/threonine protein kinase n=1 Tax=Janthinobacterium fluminis TaxID=2987524 RepID=A0ABT5JXV9_9BURK|nr:class III lanthionine synthetase LanKC [Janthinobacterium fluminis]MDC8757474.1 class III lanthionine synthetase LanKC [Janthinobacterium fluminis]